jgi:hypothetical protein
MMIDSNESVKMLMVKGAAQTAPLDHIRLASLSSEVNRRRHRLTQLS